MISPTAFLVDYMRAHGWSLPQRTFVQPLARPRAVRELRREQIAASPGVEPGSRELVFFGRLETTKGIEAFCDAVDQLFEDGARPYSNVAFLGRPERVAGEDAASYISRRAERWTIPHQIVGHLGHEEAITYLRSRDCVVTIPSLVDNSPNTVIEVVALGSSFVSSRSGGIPELIDVDDLEAMSFNGWHKSHTMEPATFSDAQDQFDVTDLVATLRVKATAAATPAAPAVDDAATDRSYDRWHRAVAGRERKPTPSPDAPPLTAAVCIVARDASAALRVAAAVKSGTRQPTEIAAVVDEPPAKPVAGLTLVTAPGRDAGPTRHRLVTSLPGDVVIVLRDHERPDPTLVEQVLGAMQAGEMDVLSFVTRDANADRATDNHPRLRRRDAPADLRAFVPVHGPALASLAYPALTVGPYAIRRSALTALGGYASDAIGDAVDRELLSRAALEGLRFDVYPDPLATVVEDDSWVHARSRYWGFAALPLATGEEQIRLLRPFRRELEGPLADLPALLIGTLRTASSGAERELADAAKREELVEAYERRIGEFNELVELYEQRIVEQRDLIQLYEDQKEEMREALVIGAKPGADSPGRVLAWRARRRLHRATRGSLRDLPGRGARFARWQIERRMQTRK